MFITLRLTARRLDLEKQTKLKPHGPNEPVSLKLKKAKNMKNAVEKISATEITLKTPVQMAAGPVRTS